MVYQNNSRARVLLGKSQQMQLVCRNEKAESEKVLGECRVRVTLWSEQTELLWQLKRIPQISLPLLHQRPLHTHFLGRWGPSSLGSTHSSHPLAVHRYKCHCHRHILQGEHKHHCQTNQGSPAELLCSSSNTSNCHQENVTGVSALDPSLPKSPGRDHLPLLAVVWVAAG